jgi:hypothetical protein
MLMVIRIREISDASLMSFIEILDESQGEYLRSVCEAAEPLLRYMFYENSPTAEFALEQAEAGKIQGLPKGSDKFLRLLNSTSDEDPNSGNTEDIL